MKNKKWGVRSIKGKRVKIKKRKKKNDPLRRETQGYLQGAKETQGYLK